MEMNGSLATTRSSEIEKLMAHNESPQQHQEIQPAHSRRNLVEAGCVDNTGQKSTDLEQQQQQQLDQFKRVSHQCRLNTSI